MPAAPLRNMTLSSLTRTLLPLLLLICWSWPTSEAAPVPDAQQQLLELVKEIVGFGLQWMFGVPKPRGSQDSPDNKIALQIVHVYVMPPEPGDSKVIDRDGDVGSGVGKALLSLLMSQMNKQRGDTEAPPPYSPSSIGGFIGDKLSAYAAPALG